MTNNQESMMERFKRFYAKLKYDEVGDKYPDEKIADWWLAELSRIQGRVEERMSESSFSKIEGEDWNMREYISLDTAKEIIKKEFDL